MRVPATGREPAVPTEADGTKAVEVSPGVYTLLANKTYYAALGGEDATQMSVQLAPANALLLTSVGFEVANSLAASELSTSSSDWANVAPASAATVTGTLSATGNTFPLAKTNGAGSGIVTMSTFPWRRGRLKIATGATGGDMGIHVAAKG